MRTRLVLVAGALALVMAPPAVADRLVATSRSVPVDSLSAYHGLLVWGGSDTESNRAAYFASRGGAVARLRVRPPSGGVLGTIDLGPGRRGGTVAVFERCGYADEIGPVRCDIYRYGFGSRRPSRVPQAFSRRFEERAPSTWRGRVVFVSSSVDYESYDEVFRGPQLGLFVTAPVIRLSRPKVEIVQTDLRGRTVAYLTTSLWVKRFDRRGRGRSCRIARSDEGGSLAEPKLDRGYVYWTRGPDVGEGPPTSIHRRRLPGRDCRSRGPEQVASQTIPRKDEPFGRFAVDGGRVFYGTTTYPTENSIRGEIWEMQPVDFTNR